MSYYPPQYVYRYNSKIRPDREFRTSDLALKFDLECAANMVNRFGPTLHEAIKDAPPDLVASLELLAEYAKRPVPIAPDELPF